jgi:hypothetical protein
MLQSSTLKWIWLAVALAVGAGVLISLRPFGSMPRADLGPGPVQGTHLVARGSAFSEQDRECAGTPIPDRLVKFDVPLQIDAATVCFGMDGVQERRVERSALTAQILDDLAEALSASDVRSRYGVACTTEYPMLASLVVELKTGEVIRPTVPIDVCLKPQAQASTAIYAIANFQFPQD